MNDDETTPLKLDLQAQKADPQTDNHCPVCGATLIQEKCKVVCRSPHCTYRIIFNCSEF